MMKATFLIVAFCIQFAAFPSNARAEERTLEEFKKYVDQKTGGDLDDAQLNEIAKLVDKNGDGKISDREFASRMEAFRKVTAGQGRSGRNLNRKNSNKKSPAAEPKKRIRVDVAPLVKSNDAKVLLISADELANAWVPFAKWKTKNGKLTKIVTVAQIDQEYQANSIQEKIRQCVRKHIDDHGTQWVILGGDCLPGGRGLVPGGHVTVHAQEKKGIPTDIVYLSKTNWDADGDGIYGEFKDDQSAIQYPDGSVGLGRIPVRTQADVAAFTRKVVAYESRYPSSQFARNMIYTCTDRPAYPKVRNSWDGYLSKVWQGEMGRFFSQETPWDEEDDPGSFPLSADNLVDLINAKSTGKFHIHGHGHLPAWVLEKSTFTGKHVEKLKNQDAYPLLTTVSCNTGEFDSWKDPSIVEHLLRVPNAGSVAVVAPIRTGKAHFEKRSDFRLMVSEGKLDGTTLTMTRYWTFGLGENLTTGEALMRSKHAMVSDARKSAAYHLCICELNLLGDPTLDMRSETPRKPDFKIAVESNKFGKVVKVQSDAPGCTVCLWDHKDVYHVTTANQKGVAQFELKKLGDHLEISLSGPNLNFVSRKISKPK